MRSWPSIGKGALLRLSEEQTICERVVILRLDLDPLAIARSVPAKGLVVLPSARSLSLIQVIEREILPQLEQRLPAQAEPARLQADPLRHRFTLVFHREGYSPAFVQRMKVQRIACLTYHKFPGEDWPDEGFVSSQVRLSNG